MRLIHASAFALCLLTVAPVGSFAADPKSDVTAAYAAWDAAFNKGDAKTVAAAYAPNAKLLPPTHEVGVGSRRDREVLGRNVRQRRDGPQTSSD